MNEVYAETKRVPETTGVNNTNTGGPHVTLFINKSSNYYYGSGPTTESYSPGDTFVLDGDLSTDPVSSATALGGIMTNDDTLKFDFTTYGITVENTNSSGQLTAGFGYVSNDNSFKGTLSASGASNSTYSVTADKGDAFGFVFSKGMNLTDERSTLEDATINLSGTEISVINDGGSAFGFVAGEVDNSTITLDEVSSTGNGQFATGVQLGDIGGEVNIGNIIVENTNSNGGTAYGFVAGAINADVTIGNITTTSSATSINGSYDNKTTYGFTSTGSIVDDANVTVGKIVVNATERAYGFHVRNVDDTTAANINGRITFEDDIIVKNSSNSLNSDTAMGILIGEYSNVKDAGFVKTGAIVLNGNIMVEGNGYTLGISTGQLAGLDVHTTISAKKVGTANELYTYGIHTRGFTDIENRENNPISDSVINILDGASIYATANAGPAASIRMDSTANDVVNIVAEGSDAWTNKDDGADKAFTLVGVETLNVNRDTTLTTGSKRGTATTSATVATETNVAENKTLTVESPFFNGGIQKKTGGGTISVNGGFNNPTTADYTIEAGYFSTLEIAGGVFELTGSDTSRGILVVTGTSEDAIKIGKGATFRIAKGDGDNPVAIVTPYQYDKYGLDGSAESNYDPFNDTSNRVNITVDGGTIEFARQVYLSGIDSYITNKGATVKIDGDGDGDDFIQDAGNIKEASGNDATGFEFTISATGNSAFQVKDHDFLLPHGTLNIEEGTVIFNNSSTSPAKVKNIIVEDNAVLDLQANSAVVVADDSSSDPALTINGGTAKVDIQSILAQNGWDIADGVSPEFKIAIDEGTIEFYDGNNAAGTNALLLNPRLASVTTTVKTLANIKVGNGITFTPGAVQVQDAEETANVIKQGEGILSIQYTSFNLGGGNIDVTEGTLKIDPYTFGTADDLNLNINANVQLNTNNLIIGDNNYYAQSVTIGSLTGENSSTTNIHAQDSLTVTEDSTYSGQLTATTATSTDVAKLIIGNGTDTAVVTLNHNTPFTDAANLDVEIAANSTLALDRSEQDETSYTFNQKLTATTGTLETTLGETADKFSLGNTVGNAFAGTVSLTKGTIELDAANNTNDEALANATLKLSTTSVADVKSNTTIGDFTTNGGTVKFTTVDGKITPETKLTVADLDVSGGLTLDLSGNNTVAIDTTTLGNQNFYDYSSNNYQQQLIAATSVTVNSGNITLIPVADSAQSRTINEGSNNKVGTATFDYNASVKDDGTGAENGVYLGYGLTEIQADSGKTVTLDATNSATLSLYAQLTGGGGFKFTETTTTGKTVTVDNSNSYTGATEVTGTNFTVKAATDDAFGQTSLLKVTDATATVNFNGKSQTVGGLAGEGEITNNNTTESTLTVHSTADSTFAGTLTGNVTLTQTGNETLTLTNAAPFAASNKVAINAGTVALDRSAQTENDYTFNQNLTGSGTLETTLGETADKFSLGSNVGSEFAGTVSLTKGTIELDAANNTNDESLENATLKLSTNSVADVQSDTAIGNFTTNGGTVKFETTEISPNTTLTVDNLDVSNNLTLDLTDDITAAIDTASPGTQNFYDYASDGNNYQQQLIAATGTVTGSAGNITLNPVANAAQSRTINNGTEDVGTATFDYNASVKDDGTGTQNGVYLGYGLTEIQADSGKTVTLDATGSTTPSLYARLTGTGGGFKFTGTNGQTVTVGNSNSNYTGAAEVTGTNFTVNAATQNAFGQTSNLTVESGATVDFDNNLQTVGGLAGNGKITNGNLTVNSTTADSTFDGTLTGTTALTKTGTEKLTLSGANDYSGATTISVGTLALTGNGSIENSSKVDVAGTFDISGVTTGSASVKVLEGSGNVTLGGKELQVAKGNFGGIISGNNGTLTKTGTGTDTLTLSNANTYSGATTINAGTLALTENGSIADSSKVDVAGTFDISGISATNASVKELAGSGNVELGDKEIQVAKGNFSGIIDGTGSLTKTGTGTDTLTLSGANIYSGATKINTGTLALTGTGSIADSSKVNVAGTFDISGVTTSASVKELEGSGNVTLGGQELQVDKGNFGGIISGNNGTLTKTGTETDKLTLSGANIYSGETTINAGTLALTGTGSIADSSKVTVNGIFDISGVTTGSASVKVLEGSGSVYLGNTHLKVGSGTFDGVISNDDAGLIKTYSADNNNTLTLSEKQEYTGKTRIESGTIKLVDDGDISESSGVELVYPSTAFDISEITDKTSIKSLTGVTNTIVKLGSKELEVANGDFAGAIEGNGTLTKIDSETSANTLELTGTNNSFTGVTNIESGTLELSGSIEKTSEINVASNATLDVKGVKTLNNLDSQGTVTFNNALTLAGNADTTISGLAGTAAANVTKTGTGTTTLGDNQADNFVQKKGEVVLAGTLTGDYTQETTAGNFVADAGTGNTATIIGDAQFNADVELESQLHITQDLSLKSTSTVNVDLANFNNLTANEVIVTVDGNANIEDGAELNIVNWEPGTGESTFQLLSANSITGTFDVDDVTFEGNNPNNRQGVKVENFNLKTFTNNLAITRDNGGTWSDSPWGVSDDNKFYNGDYVTFNGSGTQELAVNVNNNVETAGIKIEAGNWSFSGNKITGKVQTGDSAETLGNNNDGKLTVSGNKTAAAFNNALDVTGISVTDRSELKLLGNETVKTGTLETDTKATLTLQAADGKIQASNNVILNGDVQFNYDPGNTAAGDVNVITTTNGTISGNFVNNISADSSISDKLLLSAQAKLVDNKTKLNITYIASSIGDFAASNGLSGNFVQIGNLIDAQDASNHLLQQLYGLGKDEQEKFEQVLFEQLGPELAADAMQLSLWQPYVKVFNRLHETADIYGNDILGQCGYLNYELWFEGYYRSENVSRDAFANGYKSSRGGLLTGIESRLDQSIRAGLFFGYGNPRVSNDLGRIEADDITFGAYSRLKLGQQLYLNTFLAYGSQEYKYRRDNFTNYNGETLYASIELFQTVLRKNNLKLIPLLAVDFQKAWTDGFTTADTNQKIDKNSLDQTVLRIGLNSTFQPTALLNFRTRLQYGVQISGDLYGSARTSFPAKPTESRVLNGVNLGRNMFNVGIGTEIYITNAKRAKLFADYDLDLGERSTAHTAQFGFITTW